ncbi:MAG: glycosyltransferase family 4 protein [Halorientalis sp.]
MRVAFVTERTAFAEPTAGRERLRRVATNLAARDHEVTVYCTRFWPGDAETFEHEGVTYRGVTVDSAHTSFLTRLPGLLATARPDVVHASPDPPGQVAAAKAGARMARAPLVVEWYGDEDLPEGRRTRYAVRTPALVVTPSELVRTRVRELGAAEDATRVIPESIDFPLVEETPPAEGDAAADVVYARELDADANVDSLLLALAELRDRDWTATVIGEGPEREGYERQARDLRIDDRVTFAGDLDRAERVARYRAAHTFVQTASRVEFASELLWALACGCVGIVEYQAASSAHELIETYERSFRVTDDEELADAIAEAGQFDRETVDDAFAEYDHDAVLERYLESYRDCIGERGLL